MLFIFTLSKMHESSNRSFWGWVNWNVISCKMRKGEFLDILLKRNHEKVGIRIFSFIGCFNYNIKNTFSRRKGGWTMHQKDSFEVRIIHENRKTRCISFRGSISNNINGIS